MSPSASKRFPVSVSDDGEVVIWPAAGLPGGFARRSAAGAWTFDVPGACVAPTADELMEKFSRVTDAKRAEALIHEARAALPKESTMNSESLLEKAIRIAVEAHRGQKDKVGRPYILHPLAVMARVESDVEKIVAVLHDTLEDTSVTADDLRREGFPEEILVALDHVTKRQDEDYTAFVRRAAATPSPGA